MVHPDPFFSLVAALCFLVIGAASHIVLPFSRIPARGVAHSKFDSFGHVFAVEASVGVPDQPVWLALSPSSPQTFVINAGSRTCTEGEGQDFASECRWGTYSAGNSSTFEISKQSFGSFEGVSNNLRSVSGLSIRETLEVGDVRLRGLAMVNAEYVSSHHYIGRLGLGSNALNWGEYDSFIDRCVSLGYIRSPAYSIWLDTPEGKTGHLLLGAIDKSRYTGSLRRIAADYDHPLGRGTFSIGLHSIKVYSNGLHDLIMNRRRLIVAIDPADTYSFLPDDIADGFMKAAGATWNEEVGRAFIHCDARWYEEPEFDLMVGGLPGPILNVRLADLVVPREVTAVEMSFRKEELEPDQCLFGVQKYRQTDYVTARVYNLGSSLLRRTYLVFDAVNREVGIAPVNPAPGMSDIYEFAANDTIPLSTSVCGWADCPPAIDHDDETQGIPTSGSSTGANAQKPDSPSVVTWQTVLIGVFVPIGILGIAGGLVFFFTRRHKEKRQQAAAGDVGEQGTAPALESPVMSGAVPPPVIRIDRPLPLPPIDEEYERVATPQKDTAEVRISSVNRDPATIPPPTLDQLSDAKSVPGAPRIVVTSVSDTEPTSDPIVEESAVHLVGGERAGCKRRHDG